MVELEPQRKEDARKRADELRAEAGDLAHQAAVLTAKANSIDRRWGIVRHCEDCGEPLSVCRYECQK